MDDLGYCYFRTPLSMLFHCKMITRHESLGRRPAASLDESASEISAMQLRSQNGQAAQSEQALTEQLQHCV